MIDSQTDLGSSLGGQLWFCLQGSIAIFIAGKLLTRQRGNNDQQQENNSSLNNYLSESLVARGLVIFALCSHLVLVFYLMNSNPLFDFLGEETQKKDQMQSIFNLLKKYSHFGLPAILLFLNRDIFQGKPVYRLFAWYLVISAVVMIRHQSTWLNADQSSLQLQDTSALELGYTPHSNYAKYDAPVAERVSSKYSDYSQAYDTKPSTETPISEPSKEKSKSKSSKKDKKEKREKIQETRSQQEAPARPSNPTETIGKGIKEVPKVAKTQPDKPSETSTDYWRWFEILFEIIKFLLEVLL